MASRLFHTLVVCGAALAVLPLGCASDSDDSAGAGGAPLGPDEAIGGAATGIDEAVDRCLAADGGCNEHCAPLAGGGCLDPCFVHTETCSADCLLPSGECGWPPTK